MSGGRAGGGGGKARDRGNNSRVHSSLRSFPHTAVTSVEATHYLATQKKGLRRWALRERDVIAELIMSNDILQSLHLLPDSGVAEHIGSILRANKTLTELSMENAFPIDENTGEWLGVRELSRALRLPVIPRGCELRRT